MAEAPRDQNFVPTALFESSTSPGTVAPGQIITATGRIKVDASASGGTVTDVSVVTANGFAGSVATSTTTPAITLSTTITGIIQGNGTAISAITVGTGLSFVAGTLSATGVASSIVVGTTTITSGTNTRILYNNSGVLGEYTLTGSGTVVAMQTAPSFLTSITTPSVLASANDSGALGASGTAFSDLFLASGGVINWNAGNVTLTHSAGILTQNAGELRITSANVGTNADSVPTLSSTSTFTNKTLTSPTITTATLSGAQQLAEGAGLRLDASLSADGTWSGTTVAGTAAATLAFGDVVYYTSSSTWDLADADAASTAGSVMVGFCVLAAASASDPTVILLDGNIRADTAFPTFTVGVPVYISTTAGDITATAPSGTDDVIRVVGFAQTADSIFVKISPDYITHT